MLITSSGKDKLCSSKMANYDSSLPRGRRNVAKKSTSNRPLKIIDYDSDEECDNELPHSVTDNNTLSEKHDNFHNLKNSIGVVSKQIDGYDSNYRNINYGLMKEDKKYSTSSQQSPKNVESPVNFLESDEESEHGIDGVFTLSDSMLQFFDESRLSPSSIFNPADESVDLNRVQNYPIKPEKNAFEYTEECLSKIRFPSPTSVPSKCNMVNGFKTTLMKKTIKQEPKDDSFDIIEKGPSYYEPIDSDSDVNIDNSSMDKKQNRKSIIVNNKKLIKPKPIVSVREEEVVCENKSLKMTVLEARFQEIKSENVDSAFIVNFDSTNNDEPNCPKLICAMSLGTGNFDFEEVENGRLPSESGEIENDETLDSESSSSNTVNIPKKKRYKTRSTKKNSQGAGGATVARRSPRLNTTPDTNLKAPHMSLKPPDSNLLEIQEVINPNDFQNVKDTCEWGTTSVASLDISSSCEFEKGQKSSKVSQKLSPDPVSVDSNNTKCRKKHHIAKKEINEGVLLHVEAIKKTTIMRDGKLLKDKEEELKDIESKIDKNIPVQVEVKEFDIQQSLTEQILLEQAMRLGGFRSSPRRKISSSTTESKNVKIRKTRSKTNMEAQIGADVTENSPSNEVKESSDEMQTPVFEVKNDEPPIVTESSMPSEIANNDSPQITDNSCLKQAKNRGPRKKNVNQSPLIEGVNRKSPEKDVSLTSDKPDMTETSPMPENNSANSKPKRMYTKNTTTNPWIDAFTSRKRKKRQSKSSSPIKNKAVSDSVAVALSETFDDVIQEFSNTRITEQVTESKTVIFKTPVSSIDQKSVQVLKTSKPQSLNDIHLEPLTVESHTDLNEEQLATTKENLSKKSDLSLGSIDSKTNNNDIQEKTIEGTDLSEVKLVLQPQKLLKEPKVIVAEKSDVETIKSNVIQKVNLDDNIVSENMVIDFDPDISSQCDETKFKIDREHIKDEVGIFKKENLFNNDVTSHLHNLKKENILANNIMSHQLYPNFLQSPFFPHTPMNITSTFQYSIPFQMRNCNCMPNHGIGSPAMFMPNNPMFACHNPMFTGNSQTLCHQMFSSHSQTVSNCCPKMFGDVPDFSMLSAASQGQPVNYLAKQIVGDSKTETQPPNSLKEGASLAVKSLESESNIASTKETPEILEQKNLPEVNKTAEQNNQEAQNLQSKIHIASPPDNLKVISEIFHDTLQSAPKKDHSNAEPPSQEECVQATKTETPSLKMSLEKQNVAANFETKNPEIQRAISETRIDSELLFSKEEKSVSSRPTESPPANQSFQKVLDIPLCILARDPRLRRSRIKVTIESPNMEITTIRNPIIDIPVHMVPKDIVPTSQKVELNPSTSEQVGQMSYSLRSNSPVKQTEPVDQIKNIQPGLFNSRVVKPEEPGTVSEAPSISLSDESSDIETEEQECSEASPAPDEKEEELIECSSNTTDKKRKFRQKEIDEELLYKTPLCDYDEPQQASYTRSFDKKPPPKFERKSENIVRPELQPDSRRDEIAQPNKGNPYRTENRRIEGHRPNHYRKEECDQRWYEHREKQVEEYQNSGFRTTDPLQRWKWGEHNPRIPQDLNRRRQFSEFRKSETVTGNRGFVPDQRRIEGYSQDYKNTSNFSERQSGDYSENWKPDFYKKDVYNPSEVQEERPPQGYNRAADYKNFGDRRPDYRESPRKSDLEVKSFPNSRNHLNSTNYPTKRYDYAHRTMDGHFDESKGAVDSPKHCDDDCETRDLIDGPYYRRNHGWKPPQLRDEGGGSSPYREKDLFERRNIGWDHASRRSSEDSLFERKSDKYNRGGRYRPNYGDRDRRARCSTYRRDPGNGDSLHSSPIDLESPMSPEPEFIPYIEPKYLAIPQ